MLEIWLRGGKEEEKKIWFKLKKIVLEIYVILSILYITNYCKNWMFIKFMYETFFSYFSKSVLVYQYRGKLNI